MNKVAVVYRDGGLVTFKWPNGKTTETNVEDAIMELAQLKPLHEALVQQHNISKLDASRYFDELQELRNAHEAMEREVALLSQSLATTTSVLDLANKALAKSNPGDVPEAAKAAGG